MAAIRREKVLKVRTIRHRVVLVVAVLCVIGCGTMLARMRQSPPPGNTDEVSVARRAARAFCEKFGFPSDKIAELDSEPLLGPLLLEHDGKRVIVVRWLGGGRGDYIVQVELYMDSKRVLVNGGYGHKEFGPWVYRKDDGVLAESEHIGAAEHHAATDERRIRISASVASAHAPLGVER